MDIEVKKSRNPSTLTRLGVNIDHVATLRRLRDTPYPNLLQAAKECIAGGADQITVHLREDRRHIIDQDVLDLKKSIAVDLNLEMAATAEMLEFALKIKPFSICVVPEKREERTTEGGLDLTRNPKFLSEISKKAAAAGILVSFFIEPSPKDVSLSKELGAGAVEFHTGSLCNAIQSDNLSATKTEWGRLKSAIEAAQKTDLKIHAGHGIDYAIAPELAKLKSISEYNIGHAIVCEAVFIGIKAATEKMKRALQCA